MSVGWAIICAVRVLTLFCCWLGRQRPNHAPAAECGCQTLSAYLAQAKHKQASVTSSHVTHPSTTIPPIVTNGTAHNIFSLW